MSDNCNRILMCSCPVASLVEEERLATLYIDNSLYGIHILFLSTVYNHLLRTEKF